MRLQLRIIRGKKIYHFFLVFLMFADSCPNRPEKPDPDRYPSPLNGGKFIFLYGKNSGILCPPFVRHRRDCIHVIPGFGITIREPRLD